MNPSVRERLAALGAEYALAAGARAEFDEIWVDGIAGPLGATRGPGTHLDRDRFDAALIEAAVGAGARRLDGRVAGIEKGDGRRMLLADGRKVRFCWGVDATGRARTLAKLAGIATERWSPPLLALTGLVPAAALAGESSRTSFVASEGHWLWTTPSVDAFRTWTAVWPRRSRPREIDRLLARSRPGSVRGARVDWELAGSLARDRILLAGDAAGSLDPATGQGVLNALTSGIAAGRTLCASFDEPAAPLHAASYDAWFSEGLRSAAAQLDALYRERGIGWHRPS